MSTQASRKSTLDSPAIPDRLYFKIGDVARICGLETYVLRFWETQFPQLKPNKSGTGQRLYRRRDVEMVLEIKRLVHEQGYTLPGARQALEVVQKRPAETKREAQTKLPVVDGDTVKRMESVAATVGHARAELRELMRLLSSPAAETPRRRSRLAAFVPSSGTLFPS